MAKAPYLLTLNIFWYSIQAFKRVLGQINQGSYPNHATFSCQILGKFSKILLKLGVLVCKVVYFTSCPTVTTDI